ncbi:MAG: 3-oxoacyl-[Bacteroidales bacterium]|jgi:3-oxoacyl-[acyl-carrier protein] reductase|nr:3-oxoacyl-[acyl-carrier-protein] reductase [Bacteroidales bacterium]
MLLEHKTAIVTGATRGIGHAIATRFAKEGCNVAFCGRTRNDKMIAVEDELKALGVKAKGYAADVADYQSAQEFVKAVLADFGSVDILINNAGITDDSAVKRMTEEQFDRVVGTNLKSVFCMTKAIQPSMWKQGHGSIVNIGSVVGIAGNYNQANYAASKAGIIGFSKSCAKEFAARNIRVNVVAPGFVETEMTADIPKELMDTWCSRIPMKRPGTPDEVAKCCVFLASDMSSYITSVVLPMCGGMEDA